MCDVKQVFNDLSLSVNYVRSILCFSFQQIISRYFKEIHMSIFDAL